MAMRGLFGQPAAVADLPGVRGQDVEDGPADLPRVLGLDPKVDDRPVLDALELHLQDRHAGPDQLGPAEPLEDRGPAAVAPELDRQEAVRLGVRLDELLELAGRLIVLVHRDPFDALGRVLGPAGPDGPDPEVAGDDDGVEHQKDDQDAQGLIHRILLTAAGPVSQAGRFSPWPRPRPRADGTGPR